MARFQRTYYITIRTPELIELIIEPPLTAKFNIQRNTYSSANKTKLTINNLSESTRNQIGKDRYTFSNAWAMTIRAGYGNDQSELFQGNIQEAYSSKNRDTWSTNIEAFSGLISVRNGHVSTTIAANTDPADTVRLLSKSLPDLTLGAVGKIDVPVTSRAEVLEGPVLPLIEEVSGIKPFADNGILHLLNEYDVVSGTTYELTSNDFLETPRLREAILDVKTIFQPKMQVGYKCSVTSQERRLNGLYKVVGITHDVEVSGANSGTAITNLQLLRGIKGFTNVNLRVG